MGIRKKEARAKEATRDQPQSASAGFLTERPVISDQAGVSLNRDFKCCLLLGCMVV